MRAALLVLSLAAVGWLASAYPGARAEQRAAALPAAERDEARRLYAAALARRPDSIAGPRLAGIELQAGDTAGAVARLRRIVAAEPANVTAWAVLGLALAREDPAGARAALARRDALAPAPDR